MLEISTAKFNKPKKVLIDGIEMEFKAPGAASELSFNQKQRRLTYLQKKVDDGTANDEDIDRMDELEASALEFFSRVLRGTPGNEEKASEWIRETPTGVIQMSFEDIKAQIDESEKVKQTPEDGTKA